MKARDEASKAKRQETIGKAERAIDQFYEEYAAKKERAIRENKYITIYLLYTFSFINDDAQGCRSRLSRGSPVVPYKGHHLGTHLRHH